MGSGFALLALAKPKWAQGLSFWPQRGPNEFRVRTLALGKPKWAQGSSFWPQRGPNGLRVRTFGPESGGTHLHNNGLGWPGTAWGGLPRPGTAWGGF